MKTREEARPDIQETMTSGWRLASGTLITSRNPSGAPRSGRDMSGADPSTTADYGAINNHLTIRIHNSPDYERSGLLCPESRYSLLSAYNEPLPTTSANPVIVIVIAAHY
ncbi:hypothetical protein J6590_050334 [Homalodisca vitripennis]|nr:hypothetical protein J6590_050334 [Homalodisca vitripennis]